jgi:hypothetical protein
MLPKKSLDEVRPLALATLHTYPKPPMDGRVDFMRLAEWHGWDNVKVTTKTAQRIDAEGDSGGYHFLMQRDLDSLLIEISRVDANGLSRSALKALLRDKQMSDWVENVDPDKARYLRAAAVQLIGACREVFGDESRHLDDQRRPRLLRERGH